MSVEVVTSTSVEGLSAETSPMVSLNGFSPQRTTPDRVRQAISNAQRKRHKENPEIRAQVAAKLKVWGCTQVCQPDLIWRQLDASRAQQRLPRTMHNSTTQGRPPWNKGRTMSEETRQKISVAKRNRTVSKDVRRKMSASHKGKTHTAATSALLSEKLSGRPKSTAHRMAIAAAQRRRHAAARVLKAVEDVHRHAQAEGS